MNSPLTLAFDVACSPQRAFAIWTAKISTWWPRDHTVTGDGHLDAIMEGRVGGRICERTSEGVEHDWGESTVWNPPRQLADL